MHCNMRGSLGAEEGLNVLLCESAKLERGCEGVGLGDAVADCGQRFCVLGV